MRYHLTPVRKTIIEKSTNNKCWRGCGFCPWDSPGKNTGVGCHALLQGNLPNPGIEPMFLTFPALAGGFFTTRATWEDKYYDITCEWSIKYDTYELIDKTDTDSQT